MKKAISVLALLLIAATAWKSYSNSNKSHETDDALTVSEGEARQDISSSKESAEAPGVNDGDANQRSNAGNNPPEAVDIPITDNQSAEQSTETLLNEAESKMQELFKEVATLNSKAIPEILRDPDLRRNWVNAMSFRENMVPEMVYLSHIQNDPSTGELVLGYFELDPIRFPQHYEKREEVRRIMQSEVYQKKTNAIVEERKRAFEKKHPGRSVLVEWGPYRESVNITVAGTNHGEFMSFKSSQPGSRNPD